MRPYECVIVRVGEIALKSRHVKKKFFKILTYNIRTALKGVEYRIEKSPGRIFVYSHEVKRVIPRLKRVFGITSVSPCWVCYSGLNDIKILVSDVAVTHLSKNKTFAIRVKRVGVHSFSSQTIAEEAGAAVKRVTGAEVDLSNPDKTINIEVRSKRAYVFVEKIKCLGGMPVGTAGAVVCPIEDERSVVAAWLMLKRGCNVAVVSEKGNKLAGKLKKYHAGMKRYIIKPGTDVMELCNNLCENGKVFGIVLSENFETAKVSELETGENPIYRPLFFLSSKEINEIFRKI